MVIQAQLVKRLTDDGLVEFEDDVPLGQMYLVDLDTQRVVLLLNDETGCSHSKEVIDTVDGRWLPVECLKLVVH